MKIGLEKKIESSQLETKKAKLLIFGSYKLGVPFIGTDIDTICVFPNFVTKEEFLNDFKNFVAT
jgi:poly(A) polymerase Pap1